MDEQATEPEATADRGLLIGGISLMSVGGVLMAIGAVLTGAVAMRATRRWVSHWEEPPSAMARRRLSQTRSAVAAGTRGWRENGPSVAPSSAAGDR
jgi:hypothetical protein